MFISIQDSAPVGETFRVFGISSEIMYNFKCLNAGKQSLDLNMWRHRMGKESSVVDYSYGLTLRRVEWGGESGSAPHPPKCSLLTPALAPAPWRLQPHYWWALGYEPFKQFLSGGKDWTSCRFSQLCKVDTLHKCLSTIRFKLPITLGMHSLIAVSKGRGSEVE